MARHVGRLKLGSKPTQFYVRLRIIPLSHKRIIRHYVVAFVCLHFCLFVYQSAQFVQRALHYASGSRKFLRQIAQPPWGSIYILSSTDGAATIDIILDLLSSAVTVDIYIERRAPKLDHSVNDSFTFCRYAICCLISAEMPYDVFNVAIISSPNDQINDTIVWFGLLGFIAYQAL